MNKVKQELGDLREAIIEEARKKGIRDMDGLSRLIPSIHDKRILKEILNLIPRLEKWHQSIRITKDFRSGRTDVKLYEKTPMEIGEPLEGLVEIALRYLGCEVNPLGTIIRDESGLPWVYGRKMKRLSFGTIFNFPSFKEEGKFKGDGIVFTRLPNVPHMVDFESKDIAIEVKNRDSAYPYRTYSLFKQDVLDRFKRVRKKNRYLLIQEGVLNDKQRKILKQRKIEEINLKEQLRRNNQKEVYKDVFYKLEQVLSSHKNT